MCVCSVVVCGAVCGGGSVAWRVVLAWRVVMV